MPKYDFIDLDRVFVVGMSNGGGFSPWPPAITRYGVSFPVADGDVHGTSTCWSWNAADSRKLGNLRLRSIPRSRLLLSSTLCT